MGQVCSFNSPDFPKEYVGGDGITTTPTFALNPTNGAYLSATGSFTWISLSTLTGEDDSETVFTSSGTCQHATKTVSNGDDGIDTTMTAYITPYIIDSDGDSTACAIIAPSTTDDDDNLTTYTAFSCPSVTMAAVPTGTYTLSFVNTFDGDVFNNGVDFWGTNDAVQAPNTFIMATPIPPKSTTLAAKPASTRVVSSTAGTSISTTTISAQASSTSTKTIFSPSVTSTSTVVASPTSTTTLTVYTNTVIRTSTVTGKAGSTSTATTFTGTTTRTTTSTISRTIAATTLTRTVSSCAATATCPNGVAPTNLDCTKSNGTCYTASNGDKYQIECSLDRPGGDLVMQQQADMKACIASCTSNSTCVSVAYYPADGRCYLKKQVTTATSNTKVVGARLLARANGLKVARGAAIGGHPDFTYPPPPPLVTVTPSPSGTTTSTTSITATVTSTITPPPSGIKTVSTTKPTTIMVTVSTQGTGLATLRTSMATTTTTTSTMTPSASTVTVSALSTKVATVTTTKSISTGTATVTATKC